MQNAQMWYESLIKPSWAPPQWLFGPVWSVLYVLIIISFGYVFLKVIRGEWPMLVALPFALNLLCNFAFSPIQFGLQNNVLAAIDILLVLVTIGWMFYVVYPLAPWVVYINVPYALWVSFATVLQFTVTFLNW